MNVSGLRKMKDKISNPGSSTGQQNAELRKRADEQKRLEIKEENNSLRKCNA
jgi:hypothetical protein